MDDLDFLLRGLNTHDPKIRDRSLKGLRQLVAKGPMRLMARGFDQCDLATIIAQLATLAAETPPHYDVVELLTLAGQRGFDISVAIPVLEKIARIPKFIGLRHLAVKALSTYYEKTGREKPLKPRSYLPSSSKWSFQEVNRRRVYAEPDFKTESGVKSDFPCAVCGSQHTVKIYERDDSASCNISGIEDITNEIECLDCGNYSVYRYYDEWFPYD